MTNEGWRKQYIAGSKVNHVGFIPHFKFSISCQIHFWQLFFLFPLSVLEGAWCLQMAKLAMSRSITTTKEDLSRTSQTQLKLHEDAFLSRVYYSGNTPLPVRSSLGPHLYCDFFITKIFCFIAKMNRRVCVHGRVFFRSVSCNFNGLSGLSDGQLN